MRNCPVTRLRALSAPCLALASLLLFLPALYAASFDCAKAKSPAEKAVCADPALSSLDEQLAAAYKTALGKAKDKAALKARQFTWMREERDVCKDKACFAEAYEKKLVALQKEAAGRSDDSNVAAGAPFAWLLEYQGQSTNSVVWDPRFKKTLDAVAPAFKKDLGMGQEETLAATLREFIAGPPEDVVVEEKRYVVLSACRAHSCPEKAWLWIDLAQNTALGALAHYIYGKESSVERPDLLLFSKQLTVDQLSENARRHLDAWLRDNDLHVKTWRFVDAKGEARPMKPAP